MFVDVALAEKIEGANAASHRAYTQVEKNCLSLSTGGAFYAGEGDFFSQVVGWGFRNKSNEIEGIEAFYLERKCPVVAIELSTLAKIETLNQMIDRGYRVCEINHVSILNVSSYQASDKLVGIDVRLCDRQELELWAEIVAEGFGVSNHQSAFKRYAMAPSVYPFAAFVDGVMAGGGALANHDGICDLGMTSTLPIFRGRGIQKALLAARLDYAARVRGSLAAVITEPGSISDNNVRKMGFHTVYSRIKLEKVIL